MISEVDKLANIKSAKKRILVNETKAVEDLKNDEITKKREK